MPIDPELLEILACPQCKTPVVLVKNGAALKCNTCHRVYPIKDDIPVMLIDEASIEPYGAHQPTAFGHQLEPSVAWGAPPADRGGSRLMAEG